MILTILAFVFVFGVLVFVHELGHFLAAKFFGVRVDEFAFGFPPRIWSKKIKGTEYAINAIPLGGYVKLLGETAEYVHDVTKKELARIKKDAKDPANLQNKKPWQKIIIFASGVLGNLILAWAILTIFYAIGGTPILPNMYESKFIQNNQKVYVTEVEKDSPAEKAGLTSGDQIISIDGTDIHDTSSVFMAVQKGENVDGLKVVKIKFQHGDQSLEKNVSTFKKVIEENGVKTEIQRVGITMEEKGKISASWWSAPVVAAEKTWEIIEINTTGLYDFFKKIFTQFKLSKDVGGPIAIAQVSGAAAKLGFMPLLQVIAVLSVALAILNIMPFPALDGGHMLFIGIEKIIGREVPIKFKNAVNYAGFGILLLLMTAVTVSDLGRVGVIDFVKGLF